MGVILLALYGVWTVRKPAPAVDIKLLKDPQTALALVIATIASTVLFAVLFLVPIFTETVQGESATVTGLVLLPQGIVTGVGTLIGDRLSREGTGRSIRFTTLLGMCILTATTALMLLVQNGTSDWLLAAMLSGRGLALGLTIQPLLYATIGRLEESEVPDGNTLFNVMDRLGGSVGISLLATYFQFREMGYFFTSSTVVAAGNAFHDTVLLLTIVSSTGALLAGLLKGRDDARIGPAEHK